MDKLLVCWVCLVNTVFKYHLTQFFAATQPADSDGISDAAVNASWCGLEVGCYIRKQQLVIPHVLAVGKQQVFCICEIREAEQICWDADFKQCCLNNLFCVLVHDVASFHVSLSKSI